MKHIETIDMTLDQDMNINKFQRSGLYFFTMDLKYLTSTKLLGMAIRMPYIKAAITLKSGQTHTFNVVPDLMKNPCILNRYCANYSDFFALVKPVAGDTSSDVKSIRFYSSRPIGSSGFEPNFKMKLYRLDYGVKKI